MTTSLTFITMAVRNVIRNRQKTITSVLGIILAVTLIFGETIALELQSGAVLQHEMEKREAHFVINGNSRHEDSAVHVQDLLDEIHDADGIEEYNTHLSVSFTFGPIQPVVYLMDYNNSNESSLDFFGVSGSLELSNSPSAPRKGSILLPKSIQGRYDLVNDRKINLTFAARESIYNESGSFIEIRDIYFTRQFTIQGFWSNQDYYRKGSWDYDEPGYYYGGGYRFGVHLNGEDFLELFKDNSQGHTIKDDNHTTNIDFEYRSILDTSVYRQTSLVKARENADDVKQELEKIIEDAMFSGYFSNLYLDSRYEYAFEETKTYFEDVKWLIIALSIPIIIFGLYLGYLGIDLFLSERRREIGMLKARGATKRQLMSIFLTESLVVGAIAGCLGIILAGYGSRIIIRFTQASSYVDAPWYDPLFSFGSLVSAALLGMVLMFASSVRLFRRVTNLGTGELLSKYSSKQEKPYHPSKDLRLLIFAVICLIVI